MDKEERREMKQLASAISPQRERPCAVCAGLVLTRLHL
jgi:hypothetical protein